MSINATLIGQMIAFFIFAFFCMKFVWPPIIQALKEREKKIADGLAAAELGQQAQLDAEKKADEMLGEAKQQASDVIAQAQKRASQMVEDAKTDAKSEGERIVASAQADIDHQISSAKEQLRKEVSGIAVAAAGKVLKKEVNADNHGDALNELIQQI